MIIRKLCLAAFCLLSAPIAQAEVLLYSDTFTYPDGNLVGNGGWIAHSGAGVIPALVAANTLTLAQGGGTREDVSVPMGTTMGAGDKWRYEFDVTVNLTGTAPTQAVYFAHFKDATTGFNSRLFVSPGVNGDYRFGIEEVSGTVPGAVLGTDFSFGVVNRVFAEYDFDAGTSRLWVNDIANGFITSATADIAQPMSAMAFRQAGGNTSMVIDNLSVFSVAAVPEPSSWLLFSAGLGCVGFIRRRQQV